MAQDVTRVEETLATIRRLMERGQRYEAVTGRGALVAGLAAIAMAVVVEMLWTRPAFAERQFELFVVAWGALAVVAVLWIVRGALRIPGEGEPAGRFSPAARAVGRAVAPAYLAALCVTLGSLDGFDLTHLPAAWTCLHGVAILATSHHAPRRLVTLGWSFLALGLIVAALPGLSSLVLDFTVSLRPNPTMGLGFGGLNIAYGLYSLLRPLPAAD